MPYKKKNKTIVHKNRKLRIDNIMFFKGKFCIILSTFYTFKRVYANVVLIEF